MWYAKHMQSVDIIYTLSVWACAINFYGIDIYWYFDKGMIFALLNCWLGVLPKLNVRRVFASTSIFVAWLTDTVNKGKGILTLDEPLATIPT